MKRYSNLYGTIYANANSNVAVYASVGSSQRLPTFLNEIGAANAQLTVDTVRNILAGFPETEEYRAHYMAQPKNDLPVSVRYAPMHLKNHPDMPSTIKPFTAVGVSGRENKQDEGDNRYSTYVQTFYIGREHMQEAVTEKIPGATRTYNYLDQIFGTHLLSHSELALVRANRLRMDYDALPDKVQPKLRPQDRTVVFNAVDAVFENKTVVIRLERGCAFNRRAWEILIPIYALMPPRLATEMGFSTYLNAGEVQRLADQTSMRIFVLPGECEWNLLENPGVLVMDLNTQVRAIASEEMGRILNRWNRMPWEKRQIAMEKVFEDTATTYNDRNVFLQRSAEFLNQADAWEKGEWKEKAAFDTLEELKAKYDSLPFCRQIPWMREEFVSAVPTMMREKGAIHRLTGQYLAAWRIGKEEAAREMYEFGLSMGGTNPRAMADAAAALRDTQVRGELATEIAAANRKVEEVRTEMASEVSAANQRTEQVRAEGAAALQQARTDAEVALTAEREKNQAERQQIAQTLQAERDAHMATRQALDAETRAHQQTQGTLNQMAQECESVRQERDEQKQRLEKARVAYTELKKAKLAAEQELATVDGKLAQARQSKEEAEQLQAEAEHTRQKADKILQDEKKRVILAAVAGFLVAALIFGAIMLISGLSKVEKPEETDPIVEDTSIAATDESTEPTETTEPPTEEPTQATEEPTEPEIPDLKNWEDDAAADYLQNMVKGIVITHNPEEVPETVRTLEGYRAVATIRGENDSGTAVLLEVIPEKTTGEAETEPEEQKPATVTEPLKVEDALVVLTGEDFALVIYDREILSGALQVYANMMTQEDAIVTWWNVAPEAKLDDMFWNLQGNQQWWRTLTDTETDETILKDEMGALSITDVPIAAFQFDSGKVYLFQSKNRTLAEALNEKMLQMGHLTYFCDEYVILSPKAE